MPIAIRDWMSTPVVVVDADSTVSYAFTLMRCRGWPIPATTQVREIMSGPISTARA